MPGSSRKGETRLESALRALSRALDACAAPWMVIGGIAIITRGVRRLTTDIDAAVRGDAIGILPLMETFRRFSIEPRIPDAAAFAEANLVLLLRHAPTGVDLDVSLAWTSFELDAIAAAPRARYGGVEVPMASPEDLIVLKTLAGRPKDLEDAAALVALYPDVDVDIMRRRIVELAELAEIPDLVEGFDDLATRAQGRKPKKKKKKKKKKSAKRAGKK